MSIRNWILTIIAILSMGLLAQGCAIAPTDRSQIKDGETRQQVEKVLGSPIKSVKTAAGGRSDTYSYNAGAAGMSVGQLRVLNDFWLMWLAPVVVAVDRTKAYEGQKGKIEVTYGPDDRVIGMATLTKHAATSRCRGGVIC